MVVVLVSACGGVGVVGGGVVGGVDDDDDVVVVAVAVVAVVGVVGVVGVAVRETTNHSFGSENQDDEISRTTKKHMHTRASLSITLHAHQSIQHWCVKFSSFVREISVPKIVRHHPQYRRQGALLLRCRCAFAAARDRAGDCKRRCSHCFPYSVVCRAMKV